MKNVMMIFALLTGFTALAEASSGQPIQQACGSLNTRQKTICALLIQEEINANMGSVVEREQSQYLARSTVMRSDGAYLSLFDKVEAKLGGKIPGRARVQILNYSGTYSIYTLIQQIDRSLVSR